MNALAVDGPLKLLKPHTQQTLTEMQQAVERYLDDPEALTALEPAASGARQVCGVFVMLEEAEAATLMQELQNLTERLHQGDLPVSETALDALMQAVLQTPRYFEWLQRRRKGSKSKAKNPVDLKLLTRLLRAAQGTDLATGLGPSRDARAIRQLVAGLRPLLQRGTLGVLRGQHEGLAEVGEILAKLRDNAADEIDYRVWWLGHRMVDGIVTKQTEIDNECKRLLRDIDVQVKLLGENGQLDENAAEMLAQRLAEKLPQPLELASLAQRDDYLAPQQLDQAEDPSQVVAPPLALIESETLEQVATLLKDSLTVTHDALDRFSRNTRKASVLRAEPTRLHEVANVLTLIGMDVPAGLLRRHIGFIERWQAAGDSPHEDEVLDVAGHLILVQGCLDQLDDFVYEQTLSAVIAENLDDQGKVALLLEHELARARVIVTQETARLLGRARGFVINFVNNDTPPDWDELLPLFQRVGGALAMLECERAAGLVQDTHNLMRYLADGAMVPSGDGFLVSFADLVVALEQYLDLLRDSRQPDDTALDPVEGRLVELRGFLTGKAATAAATETGEQTVVVDISEQSDDQQVDQLELEIQPPAEVTYQLEDSIEFPELEVATNRKRESHVPEEIATDAAAAGTTDHESVTAGTGERPSPVKPVAGPDQDQELIEIFYEEAEGEVESIGVQLPIWRSNLFDQDAMLSIRRSFHTLKGSGRMVGELVMGEFAWSYEQLLNRIRDGQMQPSPAVADSIERAREWLDGVVLAGSVNGLEAGAEALSAEAEALMEGKSIKVEPVTPEATEKPASELQTAEPEPVLEAGEPQPVEEAAEPAESEELIFEPQFELPPPPPVAPVPPAAPPQPEAAFLAALPPGADPELVEVFVHEAADILDSSEFTLQRWGTELDNQELINDLRREIHTLKGGSRLCGLVEIGDLSHALEEVMEAVPKGDIKPTPEVLDAVQRSLDGLSNMVTRVRDGVAQTPAEDQISELYSLLGTTDDAAVKSRLETVAGSDEEFRETFLEEASEQLDSGNSALARLTATPSDRDALNDLRRSLHTIKGSSRLVGITEMGDLAQPLLELADACNVGSLEPNEPVRQATQRGLQSLSAMLEQVKSGEPPEQPAELLAEVHSLLAAAVPTAATVVTPRATKAPLKKTQQASSDTIRVDAAMLNNLINQMGESSIFRSRVDQGVNGLRFNMDEMDQTLTRLRSQMRRLEMETEAQILFRYEETSKHEDSDFDPLELDRFAELQQLSRSMMEIVDDLSNIHGSLEDQTQNMSFLLDQQGKVNKDIQQGLMRTGMVEFSTVVPRLRRVVRQAAQDLGKKAQLVVQGDDAEIDRTILDNMVAPLEHMLRNALSHGVESPEGRTQAGKPESGTIVMSLRREGSELVLEMTDDGSGINYDAIRAKGEDKGMLQPGQRVTEQELIALLLQPGFSTASEVTQIAGRGVGMDVLNEAIKEMRGALQIQSRKGRGTTFIIRLPFSLAVTQALLVRAGSDTFAVPMLSLEAVDRLSELEINSYIAGDVVKHYYGEHEYPLHSLSIMFGHDPTAGDRSDAKPAVLLFRTAEASAALQVDEILGHQEVIVKPVGPQLHNVPGISGATVLGDGRVVVVLELAALVRKLASQSQRQMTEQVLQSTRDVQGPQRTMAMVIDDSITMRKVTARFLGRHEIEVKVAKDGVEAVALLEEHVPDFIILDIEMPRMDGFEVVAHVRNQPRLKHLPIIMVTSRSGEKHRNRAAKLGVDDYLIKPYQEDELMASIQKVLQERGMELVLH